MINKFLILCISIFFAAMPVQADTFDDALAAHRAKDYSKAMQLYERAARERVPEAMFNLYIMYANGEGVAVNNKKAIKWLSRAAKANFALAQYSLGTIYENGDLGTRASSKRALKYYKLAAKNNSVDAQFRLAMAYKQSGLGLKKDLKSAVRYFKLAAEGGEPKAQYYLAESYQFGTGITVDKFQAYKWFFIAANLLPEPEIDPEMGFLGALAAGFTANKMSARMSLSDLEADLTGAQVEQAKREGQEWLDKHRR